MNITKMSVPQLVAWINIQTNSTDNDLFENSRPELLKMAKKIKDKKALE